MLKLLETQLLEHYKLKPHPLIQALVDTGKSDLCSWNAKQHGSMYDFFTTWFDELQNLVCLPGFLLFLCVDHVIWTGHQILKLVLNINDFCFLTFCEKPF